MINKSKLQSKHDPFNKNTSLTNSKKSLTRTSNKELCEILDNYSCKNNQNLNASQNSLFLNNIPQQNSNLKENILMSTKPVHSLELQNASLLKEILAKDKSCTVKSNQLIKSDNFNSISNTNNLYLVKNKVSTIHEGKPKHNVKAKITGNKKQKSKPQNTPKHESPMNNNKSESVSPYFNINKFKNHKIEEMEFECVKLANKIKLVRKDLTEMEQCLKLMQNVKENFRNEFQNAVSSIATDNKSNKSKATNFSKTSNNLELESLKKLHQNMEKVSNKNLYEPSLQSTSVKINSDEKSFMKNKDKFKTSNSNVSQISECTWVSSSFMNEISYNIKSDSSHDDKFPSNDSIENPIELSPKNQRIIASNICYNNKSVPSNNFFKKLWRNVKTNMKINKKSLNVTNTNLSNINMKHIFHNINQSNSNNVKYTKIHNATNRGSVSYDYVSSPSHYYSATDRTLINNEK